MYNTFTFTRFDSSLLTSRSEANNRRQRRRKEINGVVVESAKKSWDEHWHLLSAPPLMLECRRLEVVLASGRRRRHGSGSWSPAPLESGRRTQSVAGGSRERAKEGARESTQHHPHWDSLCCTRGKARLPCYVFCICRSTNKCQKYKSVELLAPSTQGSTQGKEASTTNSSWSSANSTDSYLDCYLSTYECQQKSTYKYSITADKTALMHWFYWTCDMVYFILTLR